VSSALSLDLGSGNGFVVLDVATVDGGTV
jgi:hypothetical protein